jgi:cyclopropane fatty-acyl-phospholipid synthase-like methyltransferase
MLARTHRILRWTTVVVLPLVCTACAAARSSVVEADRIAALLALQPGMWVADVGAGDGEWTRDLAQRVGEDGRVYATEVEEDDVEEIRETTDSAGLTNVTALLGQANDSGLPETCCDAILLRLVYHHFTDPPEMRRSLYRALRPGGLIAVIEIEPQSHWPDLAGVPDRGGHGIPAQELIEEMASEGFEMVERHAPWEGVADRYCVVFRR